MEYWKNRPEKTIEEAYGHYRLKIRYFANSNRAQVSMHDISSFQFPLIWSLPMDDNQANAALDLFKSIGFFNFNNIEHL